MNCDDVFRILTRGPFPTGTPQDATVEAHLQGCAACQRLAEALRPDHDLSRESVAPEESRAIPGYRGEAGRSSGDLAVSLTRRFQSSRIFPQASTLGIGWFHGRHLQAWEFAGAMALGIVLAAALQTLVMPAQPAWRSVGVAGGEASREPRRDAADQTPVLLDLPAACRLAEATPSPMPVLPGELPTLVIASASRAEICCTQCHRAGSEIVMSSAAMRQLQHSCRVCHD